MPNILSNHHYQAGNAFSRLILVRDSLKNTPKLCHVFENEGDRTDFEKASFSYNKKVVRRISAIRDVLFHTFSTSDEASILAKDIIALPRMEYIKKKCSFFLEVGQSLTEMECVSKMSDFWYQFSASCEENGEYRREGDSVFIHEYDTLYIVGFFDGVIDEIRCLSDGTAKKITSCTLHDRTQTKLLSEEHSKSPTWNFEHFSESTLLLHELDFFEGFGNLRSMLSVAKVDHITFYAIGNESVEDLDITDASPADEVELLRIINTESNRAFFFTKNPASIERLFERIPNISTKSSTIHSVERSMGLESFSVPNTLGGRDFYLADDVLSGIFVKNRAKKGVGEQLDLLLKISPGDYVVHRDHGIGIFRDIVKKTLTHGEREYLEIHYAGTDKLFVPLSEVYRIGKYVGDTKPTLHKLGGTEWKKAIERTTEDVEKVAHELLDIYARRKIILRPPLVADEEKERAFREAFQYPHTKDQSVAIEEILSDLAENEPMDRLLSGDVGFWKTEVAMNAAYRAILNGKQVAFISPLVVLAYDHFESLSKRFESFGIRVEVLTRLTSTAEENRILKGLRLGTINIVVGTHRLLSNDIHFSSLGLLVVDEEHKFGVLDKERISGLRSNLDILSLSATPIPRSLNLALSGVKKFSTLSTPPKGKKSIITHAGKWNEELVQEAIGRELERGGQILVLHNRIRGLSELEREIKHLSPKGTRIAQVHGRLHGNDLEDAILDFKNGHYDILLSTTVIENGVNFLRANTIIIDDADEFGLASLHQLRGRVGRKDQQAYCYLLHRKEVLADDAKKRLVAIASNSHLGAGFEIAMRDMEIRGAGEILGVKQSGRTQETGIPLYLRMLEEKVAELRHERPKTLSNVKIELDFPYSIPDTFFESEIDKIHFFRTIESITSEKALEEIQQSFLSEEREILPKSTQNLFLMMRARIQLSSYRIESVRKTGNSYFFDFKKNTSIEMLRKFLDTKGSRGEFLFVNPLRIRVETRDFQDDIDFLEKLVYS